MAKLVNLDELAAPQRAVQLKGVVHQVKDFSLKDFVAFQKGFEVLAAAQVAGETEAMIEESKSIITRSIPTMLDADVDGLNLPQLMAVVQLISDVYPEAPQGNADTGTPAPSAE